MEIQDEKPNVHIKLDCVGFKGIRKRLRIGSERIIELDALLDVCVTIPHYMRGAHLSRNYYAVLESVTGVERGWSIENYLEKIASRLLKLHSYASKAIVRVATYYYVEINHGDIVSEEPVDVSIQVEVSRQGVHEWSVGVSMYGMTACPSAQSTIIEKYGYPERPAPTHSQKAKLTVRVSAPGGYFMRIEELARSMAKAFSAPAISFLKRDMEAKLVFDAHRNPKLAEDVARDAVLLVSRLLLSKGFPGSTRIDVEVESYESIHPQNVYVATSIALSEAAALFQPHQDSE